MRTADISIETIATGNYESAYVTIDLRSGANIHFLGNMTFPILKSYFKKDIMLLGK